MAKSKYFQMLEEGKTGSEASSSLNDSTHYKSRFFQQTGGDVTKETTGIDPIPASYEEPKRMADWAQSMVDRYNPEKNKDIPLSPVAQMETEKKNDENAVNLSGVGLGTILKGADQAAGAITSTGSWLEGALLKPIGAVLGDDELYTRGPLYMLNQEIQRQTQANKEYFAEDFEKAGKLGKFLDTYGVATVAAIPQAALAFMTAGTSLGAQAGTAGLQAASTAANASGLARTIASGISSMAKNPQLWYSFMQQAGPGYDQAKADGADDLRATAYGLLTGLVNSAVEIGGGIDTLPKNLQNAARGGTSALKQWVFSSLDEGREEVVQGAISQLAQSLYGKNNPFFSVTDENAVLSPVRAAQEFAGGAFVGGLLGGGQILANSAINSAINNSGAGGETGTPPPVVPQESVQEATPGTDTAFTPTAVQSVTEASAQADVPVMESEVMQLFGNGNSNVSTQNESIGAADAGFDPYSNQLRQFGEIPHGENPARQVSVQSQTAPNRRVSYTARTILESAATPDSVFNDIGQAVTDGKFSYIPVTNQQARTKAETTIRTLGYQEALNKFRSDVMAGKASEDVTALGASLYNAAANSNDAKLALDIAYDLAVSARNGARAIQAVRILKTLTPSGRLYMLQKEINSLNEKGIGRKRSSKNNVPVDLWMQRVGENLADSLASRINAPKETIDSVTQTILKDLRAFSRDLAPKGSRKQNTRTELQRITDLFQNYRQYTEAWEAAKDTISDTFEGNPEALTAFDQWLDSSLDYTSMLTKEITGQSEIRMDEALAEKYLSAQTEEAQAEALNEIYQNIADQIPANWKDKWNAWRYMAMLANPRTHVRNIAGNVGYQPLRMVKNQFAAAIETTLDKMGVDVERTKSFSVSPDLYRAAWKDFENVSDSISGSKYNTDASSEIQDRRTIFNTKPLESIRKLNSTILEYEDSIFKRITYAGALSGYLKANGVSAQDLSSGNVNPDLLTKARDYASQEALKSTFQDRNAFSDKVVQLVKTAGPVGEALIPFKRTPANILARGFDYSPAGLLKSLSYDLVQVKNGKKTVSEAIDNVASGLTGSALFAFGAYLFSKGIVRGGEGDDKESEFDALLGHQPYSIELPGGTSITLDWLAPESLPFFMGVELANAMGEEGFTADAISTALLSVANPMFELSMLQGVNDLIDSIKFSDGPAMLAAVPSILTSYFSQAIPTIGGQLERTAEEKRMTTFTDKNSFLPSDFQYALGRASSRIPGWDFNQMPYIDAWGRTESTGGEMERFLNNFFNPAYVSQVDVDQTEKALQKIYESTGNSSVFPSRAQKYIMVNGERKDLTMDQYQRYAEKKGQLSYDTVSSLLSSGYVSGMNDEEKASAIQKVYQYADAIAKNSIFGSGFPYDWMENAKNAKNDLGISTADYIALYEKYGSALSGNSYENVKEAVRNGLSVEEYMAYKDSVSGITADKDPNGNTISGSKKEKVISAINSMDLSPSEKDWLYYLNGYAESTINDVPWRN